MIVIDTHVWIWWVDGHMRLPRQVRQQLDSENELVVSAIWLLEIATAVSLHHLVIRSGVQDWLDAAQVIASVRVEPLTVSLCVESTTLPGEFHRDPADRLIVALARQLNAPLCTADRKILAYPHVRCIDASA